LVYLVGSIILASYLVLSFKMLERLRINSFQAIVFNYWTCVITGSVINGSFPLSSVEAFQYPWLPWAVLMGFTFILLFNIIAYTAKNIGVAVASVANKLSMVIPFLFSILLYSEVASAWQIAGIVLALIAVVLTCFRSGNPATVVHRNIAVFILAPAILFIGSGLLDTMIKYVEQRYLNAANDNDYIVSAFFFAALIGTFITIVQVLRRRLVIERRAIFAGILIGIPNYFSIWCIIKVLKLYPGSSSIIIPINNMGIVLFSAVAAFLLFEERLSLLNWTGIMLAIVAIGLIAFAL
jgi:drug/metabolite transporter (DMT)-like permease